MKPGDLVQVRYTVQTISKQKKGRVLEQLPAGSMCLVLEEGVLELPTRTCSGVRVLCSHGDVWIQKEAFEGMQNVKK